MKKQVIIKWEAPEYEYAEKTPDWFWTVGVVTVSLIFSAILLKNMLFALFAGLSGFSIALYGARKPKITSFSVGPRGIQVGNKIYDYENLKYFWINYEPTQIKELIIESKKMFMPHITIMLGEADPEKIRKCLLQFLPEEKIDEPLTTTMARILRF